MTMIAVIRHDTCAIQQSHTRGDISCLVVGQAADCVSFGQTPTDRKNLCMPGRRQTVRLTKKLAALLDGIDLSHIKEGEKVELSKGDARILIAEGWASPVTANDDTASNHARSRRVRRAKKSTTRKR